MPHLRDEHVFGGALPAGARELRLVVACELERGRVARDFVPDGRACAFEVERGLLITEEVLRHLVTRVERPVRAARREGAEEATEESELPSGEEEEEFDQTERIDESESEAAPAAID